MELLEHKAKLKEKYPIKPDFRARMEDLIGKEDADRFFEIAYYGSPSSIRVNTLKISVDDLKKRLEDYGWKLEQPIKKHLEIMIIRSRLKPGELGKTKEHLLGYYYVQDISSMLPLLTLLPTKGDMFLDLCSSPGSKTTQAAAMMENSGVIVANELSLGRISILNSNLERCGVSNTIVTKNDGVRFCKRLRKKTKFVFNKILVDAPCSGEGTLRKSLKTFNMWNEKTIKNLSKIQKRLAVEALRCLEVGGEMVYSTCTLGPEENEAVVDFLIKNFDIEVLDVKIEGIKLRDGIVSWRGEDYDKSLIKAKRLYPQDNDTDGFFLCKMRKLSDKCLLEDKK
ncbi:tRNA methyltransferase [Candidatus Pacearchaeota archaeon]|nr:tRNA methyltransferase [Candidatus Pacearchaeota archaeon]|tara:strand:+ start:3021 stop:4037 length:1017 start_codon:yes stop_codon:yes gene_type:complete